MARRCPPRSSILAFNTVDRLFRGDFFHSVTPAEIRSELSTFPADWPVIGLGTTNWYRRNGELLIEGSAAHPRFWWSDPVTDLPGTFVELDAAMVGPDGPLMSPSISEDDGSPHFPFAAVSTWDPDGPAYSWTIGDVPDLFGAIARRCEAANIGLASLRLRGPLRIVEFQSMCHIPLGGVHGGSRPLARVERLERETWQAVGFYSANPTIRSVLAHSAASVHFHGRASRTERGGHLNAAVADWPAVVEVRPLQDLIVRISGLDVATLPVRQLA